MKLTQLKLSNFKTSSKLIEFMTHLESITELVTFVYQSDGKSGDALLLEYDHNNYDKVYYYSNTDYLEKKKSGCQCRD